MAIPGGKPCPVLPRVPPVQWTAWWLSPWGEGTGEVSPSPQAGTLTFLFKTPGPRPPEGGQYVGYPGKAVSRDATPRIV